MIRGGQIAFALIGARARRLRLARAPPGVRIPAGEEDEKPAIEVGSADALDADPLFRFPDPDWFGSLSAPLADHLDEPFACPVSAPYGNGAML
jgi:hypothetical protein